MWLLRHHKTRLTKEFYLGFTFIYKALTGILCQYHLVIRPATQAPTQIVFAMKKLLKSVS